LEYFFLIVVSIKKVVLLKKWKNLKGNMSALVGMVVGALIAVPPLAADMKWRSAQVSRDATLLQATLNPSYLNPNNTFRFVSVVGAFIDSNLDDLARTSAGQAIQFNSGSYDSWRLFTYMRGIPESAKQEAILRMHKLDPLNPNILVDPN
jgi:hypothetical protein